MNRKEIFAAFAVFILLVGGGYLLIRSMPAPITEELPREDPQTWLPTGIVSRIEGDRIYFSIRELMGDPSEPGSWVTSEKAAVISSTTSFLDSSGNPSSLSQISPGVLIQVLTSDYPHDKEEFVADSVTLILPSQQ